MKRFIGHKYFYYKSEIVLLKVENNLKLIACDVKKVLKLNSCLVKFSRGEKKLTAHQRTQLVEEGHRT